MAFVRKTIALMETLALPGIKIIERLESTQELMCLLHDVKLIPSVLRQLMMFVIVESLMKDMFLEWEEYTAEETGVNEYDYMFAADFAKRIHKARENTDVEHLIIVLSMQKTNSPEKTKKYTETLEDATRVILVSQFRALKD